MVFILRPSEELELVRSDGCSCGSPWVGSPLTGIRRVPAAIEARGGLPVSSRRRGWPHTGAASLPMTCGLLGVGCYRKLLGHGPHEGEQRTRHSQHHLVSVVACGQAVAVAFAQSHVGVPTEVLARVGGLFPSPVQMPTDCGGVARGPSPCDDGAPGVGVTGLGHGPLPAALATGVCRRKQAHRLPPLSGVIDACEVPACGHRGDGHGALHAPESRQRVNDGLSAPRVDLIFARVFETRQADPFFVRSRDSQSPYGPASETNPRG
jgi:hypothetical protein